MKEKSMNVSIRRYVVGLLICVLLLELMVVSGVVSTEAADISNSTVKSNIDYNIWTLDLPTGGILSSGDLKKQSYNSWWYPGTGEFAGYDMFQTPQRGAGEKEFGSQYTRCELREIIPGSGDQSGSWGTNANWGRLGYHKMITEVKVARINDNPRGDYAMRNFTCIGQLWGESGGNSAMFSLMYVDAEFGAPSFRLRDPSAKGGITYASVHIPVGVAFTVTYECVGGNLRVWVESSDANVVKTKIYEGVLADPADRNSYYFKVGNYDQSSDAKGDKVPDPNDVHTLVGFKSILVEHNPIRGRLMYANGSPVVNQAVGYVLNGGGASNFRMTTVTDETGYYDILNVPSNGGVSTASVSITIPEIAGCTSNKAGVISVAATSTSSVVGVRSGKDYDVVYSSPSQVVRESTSVAVVDYVAETLKGLNGVYTINGQTVEVDGACAIESSWFGTTLTIIKKGNGSTADSVAQSLFVKARPSVPSLGKTDCTTVQNNDGVITKVSSGMEYCAGVDGVWKSVVGSSVSGLVPGTYYVRVKATSSSFKSDNATVVINSYNATLNYTVKKGDSLRLIGSKFGVTVDAIKNINGLRSDMIYPGQRLRIPPSEWAASSDKSVFHTVTSGDTLWLLAQRYGTTVDNIKTLNNLNSDMIYPMQQLRVL